MKYKKLIFGILSVALLNSSFVYADSFTVSGNGEGSTSDVNVSQTQSTNTTQQNTADINNNVSTNANTGNNTADGNGGNTSITTGDVNANTIIDNSGINQSYVDNSSCCNNGSTNIDISGNGAYSNNSVGYSVGSGSNVSISNNAQIANNIRGYANTGYNSANGNLGNVSITTGDIYAKDSIKNKSINIYSVNAGAGIVGDISISVSGNGEGSTNIVNFAQDNNTNVEINNVADISNNSEWYLNTGYNTANGNNGNVVIATGDVYYTSSIENGPINVGYVDVSCCDIPDHPTTPPGSNPGGNPGSAGSGGGSSSGTNAPTAGQMLPVTGNYFMLILMVGNVMMLMLGGYLRLRSGRSPNLLFAL